MQILEEYGCTLIVPWVQVHSWLPLVCMHILGGVVVLLTFGYTHSYLLFARPGGGSSLATAGESWKDEQKAFKFHTLPKVPAFMAFHFSGSHIFISYGDLKW